MDTSLFGLLPGELRNRIYEFVVTKPHPIRLPRKISYASQAAWYEDARLAGASQLPAFGVPTIAQINRQFRHECLSIFYGKNTFVFVYNARTPAFETSSLTALYTVIEIIGHSIKRIQPRSFEIRFTHAINMKFSSFQHLAKCFALMHQHGLRPVTKDRIIKATTAGKGAELSAPIRAITGHLFTLGLRLAGKRCECKIHAKDKDVKACECDSQVRYELKRLIFCKKVRGEYFMRREIIEFLSKIGLRRPQVCIRNILFTRSKR
jgi:hypothetical protein